MKRAILLTFAAASLFGAAMAQPGPGLPADEKPASAIALEAGRKLIAEGRYNEAATLLESVVASEPVNAAAWDALGAASNYAENFVRANEAAEQAVALDPASLAFRFNRALTRWETGRFDGALADYDHILAARPGSASALTERGAALSALGRFEEAEASWAASLKADPGYVWAHYYRGQAAMAHGRHAEAATEFNTVLAREDFYPARLWSWIAHRLAGLTPPDLPPDTSWPGRIGAYLRGDLDSATLEAAAQQLRLGIDDRRLASAFYFIAQKQLADGQTVEARVALDRALALAVPSHPERVAAGMEALRLDGGKQ